MTKTTRIVCLCILGAVGTLCGVSTINAPITEDKTELITPTEPLRSAYIVADIAMQDPVAISVQGELYALERRVLAEYNGDNSLFTSRADVLRLDEDLKSRQPVTTYDIATGEIAKFDNTPTTTYLAPISSSGDLMLLEFTRKPTKFRLVMRPAPAETTHHFGIAMPSKEYLATLRPCFDGGVATQPTAQSTASQDLSQHTTGSKKYTHNKHVILNEVKNLSGSKTVSAIPKILRNAQDDPQHNTLSLKTYPNTPRVVKSIRNKHVILNAVKNLSGCKTVSAIPEILRNAQK